MKKHNYTHSAYMPTNDTGSVEEFLDNHDYARFLHYADILRYQMDELQAAGRLAGMLEMRCLEALQHAQYTGTFGKVEYYRTYMHEMIEAL